MASTLLTTGSVLLIIGVVMIFVSAMITGILSSNEPQPVRGGLITSTIIAVLGILLAIAATGIGISYGSKKLTGDLSGFTRRSYLNWFLILLICVIITFIICLGIDIGYNNNVNFVSSQHNALVLAVLAYFFGLAFMAVGAGCILYIYPRGERTVYETTNDRSRQDYNRPHYQRREETVRSDY